MRKNWDRFVSPSLFAPLLFLLYVHLTLMTHEATNDRIYMCVPECILLSLFFVLLKYTSRSKHACRNKVLYRQYKFTMRAIYSVEKKEEDRNMMKIYPHVITGKKSHKQNN